MPTLLTYDVQNKHSELKNAMTQMGYTDGFYSNGKWIQLPNTTLRHEFKSPADAREELKATCIRLGANLERCFATGISNDWASWS